LAVTVVHVQAEEDGRKGHPEPIYTAHSDELVWLRGGTFETSEWKVHDMIFSTYSEEFGIVGL
jgi:hypothetical protein